MTTTIEKAVLDTNVLVYAHLSDSPHYSSCHAQLMSAVQPDANLHVFPQMIAEFFSVMTNPKRVTIPLTTETAIQAIRAILALPGLTLLMPPNDIVERWLILIQGTSVKGFKVFDYLIAAAMQAHGIGKLFTHNVGDFSTIPGIQAVIPAPTLSSGTP